MMPAQIRAAFRRAAGACGTQKSLGEIRGKNVVTWGGRRVREIRSYMGHAVNVRTFNAIGMGGMPAAFAKFQVNHLNRVLWIECRRGGRPLSHRTRRGETDYTPHFVPQTDSREILEAGAHCPCRHRSFPIFAHELHAARLDSLAPRLDRPLSRHGHGHVDNRTTCFVRDGGGVSPASCDVYPRGCFACHASAYWQRFLFGTFSGLVLWLLLLPLVLLFLPALLFFLPSLARSLRVLSDYLLVVDVDLHVARHVLLPRR